LNNKKENVFRCKKRHAQKAKQTFPVHSGRLFIKRDKVYNYSHSFGMVNAEYLQVIQKEEEEEMIEIYISK